jgi:hypothetical protein
VFAHSECEHEGDYLQNRRKLLPDLLVNAYDAQSPSREFKYGQRERGTKQVKKVEERDRKVGELPRRGGAVNKIRTEGCL